MIGENARMATEPRDARERVHRERVVPGPAWWLVVGALVAMLAIAYGAALGSAIGALVAVVLAGLAVVAMWRSSPTIEVGPWGIAAGGADLPVDGIESARVIRGADFEVARRGMDATVPVSSYSVVPAWAPRSAVVVYLSDADDPHRAWLLASRHADRLLAAITGAQGDSRSGDGESPTPG